MTFSCLLTAAGSPYNLYNIIRGTQTTGVTKRTGIANFIPPVNASRIVIANDPSSPGSIIYASGINASITNNVGKVIAPGDDYLESGEGAHNMFSLKDRTFAVEANDTIVTILFEG